MTRCHPTSALLTTAAVLLLSACSAQSAPLPVSPQPPVPPRTVAESSGPVPSATATTATGAPGARTEHGAKVFVARFIDTFNQLALEPRTGVISALGTPECRTCARFEEEQAYLVRYAQHYAKAPNRLDRVTARPGTSPGSPQYVVVADITTFGVPIVDASGTVLRHDEAGPGTYAIYLEWDAGRWRVAEMKSVS